MRDLATGMLGVYFFGEKLCKTIYVSNDSNINRLSGEEPDFSWALSRYYDDTVTCMGALQIVPAFLQS